MKQTKRKILIVHVNEMKQYAGYPGDIDPREKHNHASKDGVSERFNFKLAPDGKFYGAWCKGKVELRRIDPQLNKNAATVDGVLLVFWATVGKGVYRIVGWYKDATIWKEAQTNRSKDRDIKRFIAEATRRFRLPREEEFSAPLPVGKKGGISRHFGHWYAYSKTLERKNAPWLDRIISSIDSREATAPNGDKDEDAIDMDTADYEKRHGFLSNARIRRAIELFAEKKAIESFKNSGYTFVRKVGKPFDLIFAKGSQQLFVEVKGTQVPNGGRIFLTYNEVKCAKEKQPNYALFQLHSININSDVEEPKASGGVERIIHPFQPKDERLKAINYQYELDPI